MPDFLSHVLVMYIILQTSGWWIEWLDQPRIVVGMAGALIPDIIKLRLLVPGYRMEALLGVPFSWTPLHRFGGALVTAAILSLFVDADERRGVFVLLVAGLVSHLILDAFLARPGPYTYDLLYPVTGWKFPILDVDLYLSSDYWPSIMSAIVAVAVFGITQVRFSEE